MTDYERIKQQFEAKSVCKYGKKPILHYDGMPWIECSLGDACKCRMHDGEGFPISQLLANWQKAFG